VDQGVRAEEASTDLRIDLERALRQLNRDQRAVLYLFFARWTCRTRTSRACWMFAWAP
jgi:hypothetical protein